MLIPNQDTTARWICQEFPEEKMFLFIGYFGLWGKRLTVDGKYAMIHAHHAGVVEQADTRDLKSEILNGIPILKSCCGTTTFYSNRMLKTAGFWPVTSKITSKFQKTSRGPKNCIFAAVVEQADTPDLKSGERRLSYRFDPGQRHHFPLFSKENGGFCYF